MHTAHGVFTTVTGIDCTAAAYLLFMNIHKYLISGEPRPTPGKYNQIRLNQIRLGLLAQVIFPRELSPWFIGRSVKPMKS